MIVVTGGSGFIGSHLVARIDDVVALDSNPPRRKDIRSVQCDIMDAKQLAKNFAGADTVVHLAAKSTPRDNNVSEFYEINIKGTLNVLDAARKNDVRKIVFASSSSVYGNGALPQNENIVCTPNSFYGASKLACEHIVRLYGKTYGIDTWVPRFFTVYGSEGRRDMAVLRFIENIHAGREIEVFGRGKIRKDFIHVDDVVDAIKKMVQTKNGGVVNVGTGRATELNELVKHIENKLEKKAKIKYTDQTDADTCADTTKAEKDLKWKAKIPIEKGIEKTVDWWVSEQTHSRQN